MQHRPIPARPRSDDMSHWPDIKQALEDVSSGIADLGNMLDVEERLLAEKRSDFDRSFAAHLQARIDANKSPASL